VLGRAKNAAFFAAIDAWFGGLFGRSTANNGTAAGALIDASMGERRASPGFISQPVKEDVNERVIQPR
jgi:hypothetical protein